MRLPPTSRASRLMLTPINTRAGGGSTSSTAGALLPGGVGAGAGAERSTERGTERGGGGGAGSAAASSPVSPLAGSQPDSASTTVEVKVRTLSDASSPSMGHRRHSSPLVRPLVLGEKPSPLVLEGSSVHGGSGSLAHASRPRGQTSSRVLAQTHLASSLLTMSSLRGNGRVLGGGSGYGGGHHSGDAGGEDADSGDLPEIGPHVFEEAQAEVLEVLQADVLPRFCRSEMLAELILKNPHLVSLFMLFLHRSALCLLLFLHCLVRACCLVSTSYSRSLR
jgi:hypothetical protein